MSPSRPTAAASPRRERRHRRDLGHRERRADARLHHGDRVWTARYSPDGRRIVTASNDRTAILWDAATGVAQLTLTATSPA